MRDPRSWDDGSERHPFPRNYPGDRASRGRSWAPEHVHGATHGGWGSWSLDMDHRSDPGHGMFEGVGPKNYRRTDERIREDVCDRLTDADLDVGDVDVTVKDGEVTLEGTSPDRRTKRLVEQVADGCLGVKDVHNRLRVGAAQAPGRAGGRK